MSDMSRRYFRREIHAIPFGDPHLLLKKFGRLVRECFHNHFFVLVNEFWWKLFIQLLEREFLPEFDTFGGI
jgi:hypothetical protein